MNVDAIVISDSSEDEENPKKRVKHSHVNKCTLSNIRISQVTSLAANRNGLSSEIVIIDDDDEAKNSLKMDDMDNISVKSNVANEQNEHNVCKNETITNGDKKNAETHNNNIICNNEVREKVISTSILKSESGNNDPVLKNEEKNETSENSVSVMDATDNIREISSEFNLFLDQCISCECDRKYMDLIKKKVPVIKQRYMQANPEFVSDKKFIKLLNENIERMKNKPADAIICFNNIWEELGIRKEKDNIDLTDREAIHIKKLSKTLRLLNKKIKKLEEEPVNWDDDDNSAYIQLERYRKRFCDIHKKICSYIKQNPLAGRPIYRKLNFDASKYSDINRAVEKLYNKTKSFPTYYEVDRCVKKCVKDNNLNISGDLLDLEIRQVFTAIGKLLQKRRKNELRITLDDFLDITVDPALNDANLKFVLDKQYEDGKEKIEAVLQKYTDKQEAGEDPSVSSDTDDSNHESDMSDNAE